MCFKIFVKEIAVLRLSGNGAVMIKPILQLGNETLRKKSSPVKSFHTKSLDDLAQDLSDTLKDAKKRFGYGRGIAAPQIGEFKRVVLVDMPGFKGLLINPKIVWRSDAEFEVWDSCFSFNVEFFVLVDRHRRIKVEYSDHGGKHCRLEARDGLSELLQHEIDHLDGFLATDRMKDNKGIMMRSEWERLKAGRQT